MTFAIIFLLVFAVLGVFTLYLSRTIEYGEARFDTRNDADEDSHD